MLLSFIPPQRLRGILESPAMLCRYAMACRSHCNDDSPGSNGPTTSTMTSGGLQNRRNKHLATLKLESKFKVPPIFLGEGGEGSCHVLKWPKSISRSGGSPNRPSLENCTKKNPVAMKESNPIPNEQQQHLAIPPILDMTFRNRKKHVLKQS